MATLPKPDLSKIEFPRIDFSHLDAAKAVDTVTAALRDGAYITIGLGVIGVQTASEVAKTTATKAQEIAKQYTSKLETATKQYNDKVQTATKQYGHKVQTATKQARTAAGTATKQVKGVVRNAA